LVERLQRSGLLDDTLIVFTSDHGEMLGDHHLWRKTYAYEASARVPLIAVAPGSMNVERNVECDALIGWEDIMPTFLQAAETDQPESVEGHSVLELLKDPSDTLRPYYHGEHAPCYHPENANQFLTDARWKYIWNPINGEEQLFDLQADPHECADLARKETDVLAHWRQTMARQLAGREEQLSDGTQLRTGAVQAWRFAQADELHLG
jgi:arylsulfatase